MKKKITCENTYKYIGRCYKKRQKKNLKKIDCRIRALYKYCSINGLQQELKIQPIVDIKTNRVCGGEMLYRPEGKI